ncbi:capsular polysaccharide export protein, LipB/KpsS family [Runella limosa]|uniref:capsular polysaccharide export protein, LipB/KpsS family n=1 Tax=Runella limosa TaxID=370978 RepID=UPI000408C0CB|nr:hypothetical protein [Runella limosa]
MKDNILILINQAPNYAFTYKMIGDTLEKKGINVYYAIDSYMTYLYFEKVLKTIPKDRLFIFSSFFKVHYKDSIEDVPVKYNSSFNLWQMFYSDFDRFTVYGLHKYKSKNYFKKLIANLLAFYEDIFSKYHISHVIYENVSNTFAYAGYVVACKRSVSYLGICATALPGRFAIQHTPYFDKIKESFNQTEKTLEANIWIQSYLEKFTNTEPDYMKANREELKESIISRYLNFPKIIQFYTLLRYLVQYPKDNFYNFQYPVFSINIAYIKRALFRKLRLPVINRLYEALDNGEKYFLYPIHFHPEASTSIFAPSYNDEYHNIEQIAFNIPFGTVLYVKEHPCAVGFSPISFYKKVKRIPNVKLISHNHNAKELARNSEGVITVTSTVGFEALILGKPVFLLGEAFYSEHPNCRKVSFSKLFDAIQNNKVLENNPNIFLSSFIENTYDGSIEYLKKPSKREVSKIVEAILNEL